MSLEGRRTGLRWAQACAERVDPLAEVQTLPCDPEGYNAKPLELDSFSLHEQAGEEVRSETR
jgi:hypothetical protein